MTDVILMPLGAKLVLIRRPLNIFFGDECTTWDEMSVRNKKICNLPQEPQ